MLVVRELLFTSSHFAEAVMDIAVSPIPSANWGLTALVGSASGAMQAPETLSFDGMLAMALDVMAEEPSVSTDASQSQPTAIASLNLIASSPRETTWQDADLPAEQNPEEPSEPREDGTDIPFALALLPNFFDIPTPSPTDFADSMDIGADEISPVGSETLPSSGISEPAAPQAVIASPQADTNEPQQLPVPATPEVKSNAFDPKVSESLPLAAEITASSPPPSFAQQGAEPVSDEDNTVAPQSTRESDNGIAPEAVSTVQSRTLPAESADPIRNPLMQQGTGPVSDEESFAEPPVEAPREPDSIIARAAVPTITDPAPVAVMEVPPVELAAAVRNSAVPGDDAKTSEKPLAVPARQTVSREIGSADMRRSPDAESDIRTIEAPELASEPVTRSKVETDSSESDSAPVITDTPHESDTAISRDIVPTGPRPLTATLPAEHDRNPIMQAALEAPPSGAAAIPQPSTAANPPIHLELRVIAGMPYAAEGLDGLALRIAAKSSEGENEFTIRLDPPELGGIEVKLHINESGKTSADLAADLPQTLDLLQRDSTVLERTLKDAGIDLSGGLSFSLRSDGEPGGGRNMPEQPAMRHAQFAAVEDEGVIAIPAASLMGEGGSAPRLDISV